MPNKCSNKNPMCINVHADTPPIIMLINSKKVPIIYEHVKFLSHLLQLTKSSSASMSITSTNAKPAIQLVSPTEVNASIKEFMEMESNSENSLRPKDAEASASNGLLFCQWTITKVTISLEDFCSGKCKVVLEVEDLLATVDQRDAYTKCTGKVGHLNMGYYEFHEPQQEWKTCGKLEIKVLTEASGSPFLQVILTSVALRDYYSRVGIKRQGDPSQNITEIIVDMMALEVTVDLDKLEEIMTPLCSVINEDKQTNDSNQLSTNVGLSVPMTAQNMPMVHLKSRGFTCYMPLKTKYADCSAFILKINSILVTPNLENPLQRTPVRADVFFKAAQMGLLGLPGAIVEDRQYELTLMNISAATGNWQQIYAHLQKQNTPSYHTNPAFEWNNQNHDAQLQLNDIFNDFTFSMILAPYITYNNVLICGQSVEFNCTNDFDASINMHQLKLLISICNRFQNLSSCKCMKNKENRVSRTNLEKNNSKINVKTSAEGITVNSSATFHDARGSSLSLLPASKSKTDSGFQSLNSARSQEKFTKTQVESQLPQTISFVAGMFLIKIFDVRKSRESNPQTWNFMPLFAIRISQPSFMFTQQLRDYVIQMSLFNLSINSASRESPVSLEEPTNLFTDVLFETKSGELTATGIPPPLMSLKIQSNALQLREVDIEIAKPMFLSLNEQRIFSFVQNSLSIYGMMMQLSTGSSGCAEVSVVRASKLQLLRMQFFNADRLLFKCKYLTLDYIDRQQSSCKFVVADARAHIKFLLRPEKAAFKISVGSLHFQTDQKIFLHPVNMQLSVDLLSESWHKLPIMNCILNLNVVQMDVSIYSILRLKSMTDEIQQLTHELSLKLNAFQKHQLASSRKSKQIPTACLQAVKCPSNVSPCPPRRCDKQKAEYYQDDLRAGAFQFVELTTDSFLPLPYQIQIIKKDFGIICWRYPQPRKISKIFVYPVLMDSSRPMQIKCVMEYFSEVHESFLPYCQFSLSETNTKELELPERSISAHIWRVVILQALVTVNGECFDASEEDEDSSADKSKTDVMDEHDFVLDPKVLVACMRVDTIFEVDCIPKCQLLIKCNMLQVKLLNQPDEVGELPAPLEQFSLAQPTSISQEFLVMQVMRLACHANFYASQNYEVECKLALVMHCLDQSYLIMLPLLDPTNLSLWLHMNGDKREAACNLLIDRFHVHLGAVIVQTLLSSQLHWEQQLSHDKVQILLPKCLVANDTHTQLVFGQTGTSQRIVLGAKQCHSYAFVSTCQKQELTFYVLNNETNAVEISQSAPIDLKMSGTTHLQPIIIGRFCLLIQSTRLSATQMYVQVKGQIEVISMVRHSMRLEFHIESKDGKDKPHVEHNIEKCGRGSFINSVKQKTNIFMR